MQTVVGTVVDPMADKALMTIVVVVLGINGALPGMWKSLIDLAMLALLGRVRTHRTPNRAVGGHWRKGPGGSA